MGVHDWIDDITARDWRTDASGTVRFALVGLGWWTTDVAMPAIEATELCETTTLVSSRPEKARSMAADHDVAHGISYEQFHAGELDDAYDAVYIATPNALHLEYAATAAEQGVAVLCEKPMEATAERAEAMLAACADVPFMVAYRMQTDPLVRRTRELVQSGAIGTPRYVSGSNEQPLLDVIPDEDQWRLDPDLAGYGTSVMDIGIYVINTARFVLDRDPIAAYGRMGSEDPAFADVPDQWASFSLLLEGDVPLVGTTSQDAHGGSSLRITGTAGRVSLEPAYSGDIVLTVERGGTTVEVRHDPIDAEAEMREEFDYFADRVLGDASIHPDGAHGLVDMATIAGIHRAADADAPVEL